MLKQELEKRIGFELSETEFICANAQYMECDLNKDDFAKAYKKFYFALHPEKETELNEAKRRSNMTNKEKLEEDLKGVCKTVESEYPLNDLTHDLNKVVDNYVFDIYFLLRETGSELYTSKEETFSGNRCVDVWKKTRVKLYHVVGNYGYYNLELIEEY